MAGEKTFTQMSDAEIWSDLDLANLKAEAVKQSPLMNALRQPGQGKRWCCDRIRSTSQHIQFSDGTSIRVHFCPRCGREL